MLRLVELRMVGLVLDFLHPVPTGYLALIKE